MTALVIKCSTYFWNSEDEAAFFKYLLEYFFLKKGQNGLSSDNFTNNMGESYAIMRGNI